MKVSSARTLARFQPGDVAYVNDWDLTDTVKILEFIPPKGIKFPHYKVVDSNGKILVLPQLRLSSKPVYKNVRQDKL